MYDTHPSLRFVKEMRLMHALPSDLRASVVKLHAGTKEVQVQDDRQQICINGSFQMQIMVETSILQSQVRKRSQTRLCVSNNPAGAYIVAAAVLPSCFIYTAK